MLQCTHCDDELTEENTYKRSGRRANFPVGYYRICKKCYSKNRHRRVKQNRTSIIKRMGSKCSECGYDQCQAALELHHLDPSTKDAHTTKHLRHITDNVRLTEELSKCVLLCANCHREAHHLDPVVKRSSLSPVKTASRVQIPSGSPGASKAFDCIGEKS